MIPVITNDNTPVRVIQGNTYANLLTLTVDKGDNDLVYYTVKSASDITGLSVNNDTRIVSWNAVEDGLDYTTYISFIVSDGKGSSTWSPYIQYCNCKVWIFFFIYII